MPNEVYVSSFSSGVTAIPIMAENIGSTNYVQVVKLAGGQIGSTEQIPGDSTMGIWAQIKNVPTVAITGPAMVTGQTSGTGMQVWLGPSQTVLVSVSIPAISTTAVATTTQTVATGAVVWLGPTQTLQAVNTVVTVLGTVAVNVVAGGAGGGTMNISGVTPVTTQTSVSVTGVPVWFYPGALVGISVSQALGTVITILGTQVVSVVPGVSVSAQVSGTISVSNTVVVTLATGGTIATILGTQLASVVPGVSVNVGSMATIVGTTTGTSGATGMLVWLGVGQTLATLSTVGTILGTQIVTLATGATIATLLGTQLASIVPGVSVNLGSLATVVGTTTGTSGATGPIVWLGVNQSVSVVNTIVTILGTQIVSVVPGVSVQASISNVVGVTTQTSVSVTGLPVYFQPGALVGISVSQALGTVITILGTQVVSVVPGLSVSLGSLATVVGSTTGSSGVTGALVWLGANQTLATVGTVSTVLGTVGVSISAVVAQATQVATTGIPVWLAPTQTMTVAVSGAVLAATTQTAITGAVIWMAPTQTMIAGPSVAIPVVIMVSSTALASGTTMLMTIYTGATNVTAGASFWVVPSGKTFRVQGIQCVAASSAVVAGIQVLVIVGTAAASLTVTSTVGVAAALPIVVTATQQFQVQGLSNDIAAGTTVGLGNIGGTAWNLGGAVVQGFLY